MKHDIFGMNVFVFVSLVWLLIVALICAADFGPGLYFEHKIQAEETAALQKGMDSELTQEMPAGSFDPDETMKLALYREHQVETINENALLFVINKRHAPPGRRRHAKA